jgi:hypothetical protein
MPHGIPCACVTGSTSYTELVINEGYFTLEAKRVFLPYLPSHCSSVAERCHVVIPAHALRGVEFTMKSFSTEGHFSIEAKTFFVCFSPCVEFG